MKYDVTIGIPVYRSVDYIKRALDSALNQTYASIEFLIIDDGGKDGSMDVVRQYVFSHPRGQAIHIVSHAANQGVSASRNDIIKRAEGTYLYFMDSDDVIAADTISLMMQNVRQYDAEIVFGSYERIDTNGAKVIYQYPHMLLLEKDGLASFAYRKYAGIQASSCNYLVKTSVLRDNNLWFIDANYWEDLVFTFDLVTYISRAVLLSDITYSYLCRENSLSHYQQRTSITKEEIMSNVNAIAHLKQTSTALSQKVYFPNRCYNIVMTDFYIACNILKRRHDIAPPVTFREIRDFMRHPATWSQIRSFRQSRLKNMLLFMMGRLPAPLCVSAVWTLGKLKKLV